MAEIRFADVSEYQETFSASVYRGASNQVIIARVHNGHRPDKEMPGRRIAIRAVSFVAVGYYIYLVSSRDPAQQVREAIDVIGHLLPNEFPIVDYEEAAGNDIARCQQACNTFDQWAGFPCTLYSGESFFKDHLGGSARWRRPKWMAKYLNSRQAAMSAWPAGATFWQYSEKGRFAGLPGPVDASVYRDTAVRFLAEVRAGAPKPKPVAREPQSLVSVVKEDGRIETFEETSSGEVVHKWQTAVNDGWADHWQSLGKPG